MALGIDPKGSKRIPLLLWEPSGAPRYKPEVNEDGWRMLVGHQMLPRRPLSVFKSAPLHLAFMRDTDHKKASRVKGHKASCLFI